MQGKQKLVIEYTRSDLEERLEAVRTEAEKYQDDQTMSQTSRYATAEYVRKSLGPRAEPDLFKHP